MKASTAPWTLRFASVSLLLACVLVWLAPACCAGVRVQQPEKFDPALLQKLVELPSDKRLAVWVRFKDRPVMDRAAWIRWTQTHRNLPPVDENHIQKLAAVVGVHYRAVDELFNEVSVELPAGLLRVIDKFDFVDLISEVQMGSQAWTVDSHSCTGEHKFSRWEQWNNQSILVTRSLVKPMNTINISSLHNSPNFYNGSGVKIGILDSGIRRDHECFDVAKTKTSDNNLKVCAEKDFTEGKGDSDDGNANTADDEIGHGTACAGVAAGYDYHNSEYIGTAPDAKLAIAKIGYYANNQENFPQDYWVNGIKWLVNDAKVDVISSSINWEATADGRFRITRWADWAAKQGIVVCIAMGNKDNAGEGSLKPPADAFNCISVAASKTDGASIAPYSCKGVTADKRLKPDVTAPGGSTDEEGTPDKYNNYWISLPHKGWTDGYQWWYETSFAAPIVAGTVACMMERSPSLKGKPLQVRTRLWETAVDKGAVGPDTTWGFGLLDANAAASNAKPQLIIRDLIKGNDNARVNDNGFVPSCDVGGDGGGNPTPNGVYEGVWTDDPFWISPSIFVDNNQDNQPDQPNQPIAGQLNWFKVRVDNIGDATAVAANIQVKLYKTDPNTGMKNWDLIDTKTATTDISANSYGLVELQWNTPALNTLGQQHWCIGATVEYTAAGWRNDKAPLPGQEPSGARPAFDTMKCDNLAIRNFFVQAHGSPVVLKFRVQNTTELSGPVLLQLLPQELPPGWYAYLSQDVFVLAAGQEAVPPPTLTISPSMDAQPGDRSIVVVQAVGPNGSVMGGFTANTYIPGPGVVHGDIAASKGAASPTDHVWTTGSDPYNEMLQFRLTAQGGLPPENIRLKSVSLSASGGGDDLADVASVDLWIDVNSDGIVQNPGDIHLANGTYSADNGYVKLAPAVGYILPSGLPVYFLVSYTMSGTGNVGDTYKFELVDIDSAGLMSGARAGILGLSIESCETVRGPIPLSTLTAVKGLYSPTDHWGFSNEENIMLQVYLSADRWEPLDVSSISLTSAGTGNDAADISLARVYLDTDSDGKVDAGDTLVGSGKYPSDNSTTSIATSLRIARSSGVNLLVTYAMASELAPGSTYRVTLADVSATGALTGSQAAKVGLPIAGSTKTIGRTVPGQCYKIGDWQREPDGTLVSLRDVVVTVGYNTFTDSRIYVEEQDRSHGIMIYAPSEGLCAVEGQIFDVEGVIDTDPVTMERRIVQPSVILKGSRSWLKPLGVNLKSVGGADFGFYKKGIMDGVGLNNVGTLVRVFGRMTGGDGSSFFILSDNFKNPVFVDVSARRTPFCWPPAAGYVMLNGVVTLRHVEAELKPAVVPCLFPEMVWCVF
ncbi:MAG: S8 family serine peptidase [Armatimonadota bacterium]|nr:S8 family serine peptidase [Armatimonadota bacterium]